METRGKQDRWKQGLRLQIKAGVAIGPGKATLLEKIVRLGSISAAAREMEMGYKTAWIMVESMNSHFVSPLVESTKGGSRGGGARLTGLGYEVLQRYRSMEAKALGAIEADVREFEALLNSSEE